MFSPLDILYIVLAFCTLWFTAAIFWLVWQIAMVFRNVNETLTEAREVMGKIEVALSGMRQKVDQTSTVVATLMSGITRIAENVVVQKLTKMKAKKTAAKKSTKTTKK